MQRVNLDGKRLLRIFRVWWGCIAIVFRLAHCTVLLQHLVLSILYNEWPWEGPPILIRKKCDEIFIYFRHSMYDHSIPNTDEGEESGHNEPCINMVDETWKRRTSNVVNGGEWEWKGKRERRSDYEEAFYLGSTTKRISKPIQLSIRKRIILQHISEAVSKSRFLFSSK